MDHLSGRKIKSTQVLISKLELEKQDLDLQNKTIQSKRDKLTYQIKLHKDNLEKLKKQSNTLIVSEHALIRYLQRVYKLDLEKIEKEILSNELIQHTSICGSGTYAIDNQYKVKVVDNVVVTILDT